jgi:two-component system, cell cycle sensor histidine kinase and response regulator CckA
MIPVPRILVVDDTVEVRSLVSRILVGRGYQVVEAENGIQALSECETLRGDIDLLVTDVKMPGMDGLELADAVTRNYPAVRVLLVSGQCEEVELQHHVIERHFEFLSKPFMPNVLVDRVEQMLKAPRRPPGSAGPAGGGGQSQQAG